MSGDEAVAAAFGDQKLGVGRVLFYFLAQTVDVGLEGVGGNGGVIAPNFMQKDVAADDFVARAEEKLEY